MCDAAAPSVCPRASGSSSPHDAADVEDYYREIAPFYDAELEDRDDLDFWRRQAAASPGARILDLGAGSGTVTAQLAPLASLVVGVDVSDELLQLGRNQLQPYPHAHLIKADMRSLPFGQSFDLIVAANDPFSHLIDEGDRDTVLQGVARLLAPTGRFILDALWLPPSDARAVRTPDGRVQEHTSEMNGQPLKVVERWRRDPDHRWCCHARYEYHRPGQRPVVASFEARDWTPSEVSERLARARLVSTERFGSYDSAPWNPRTSQQLIVVAKRAP